MKCIIPAAGFGTRMSMAMNKSKEMLPDPENKRVPLIDYVLSLCQIFKIEPLVVTREEKTDLRQYLFNRQVEFIDIEPEGEWYDSVLKSKDHWQEHNILILPDTRFYSVECIQNIKTGLELGNKSVFALHKVKDPQNWGVIKEYSLYEKTKDLKGEQWAWGLVGFEKFEGEAMFSAMSDQVSFYLEDTGFTFLKKFEDITRGSK